MQSNLITHGFDLVHGVIKSFIQCWFTTAEHDCIKQAFTFLEQCYHMLPGHGMVVVS